ncbi:hypothetical protein CDAR_466251 [Caerostris darwini]|uniref:Uncharacterized protein n=1 Tax=Caerostris darwini TaxID=1538125 RepID=A0AAV4WSX3_9ARAC|nr:hypothetical protein CDAR_466251 [Caerostris darwini]
MLKEAKTKTLVSRKDSAVTNNLPSNWTGDEGEGEPLGTRVFCPHLLDVGVGWWEGWEEAQDEELKYKKRNLHLEGCFEDGKKIQYFGRKEDILEEDEEMENNLYGSSSLTLQLPILKEVKTKTLVSRKDSAVTNNLPSNWTGDEGEGEPLGTRVFCPHLLDGSFSLTLQLPMLKEVKTKTLVSRKDSAITNNLPSNWTRDEEEGEPLGTRNFYPPLLDVKGGGGETQDEELKWKKKKPPSGVVDNGG